MSMKNLRYRYCWLGFVLILLGKGIGIGAGGADEKGATSADALAVGQLEGRINDRAEVLSPSTAAKLETYLAAVEQSTGAQLVLLTIPSLKGEPLEAYSLKVATSWGIGGAENDNGVLLLVAMEERKIRIEVGYGLEAMLTDAMSGYIIREAIIPEFKKGNFDGGIEKGLRTIGAVLIGDAPVNEAEIQESENQVQFSGIPLFFFIFILLAILGRIGRYGRYRRRGMSPFAALFLGSMLGGSSRRGGFGGGGFGGGFSGGGGSFGGGGASGGW